GVAQVNPHDAADGAFVSVDEFAGGLRVPIANATNQILKRRCIRQLEKLPGRLIVDGVVQFSGNPSTPPPRSALHRAHQESPRHGTQKTTFFFFQECRPRSAPFLMLQAAAFSPWFFCVPLQGVEEFFMLRSWIRA